MENASKALIIAGAVLIGILIISMGVLLATTLQKTAKTYYSMKRAEKKFPTRELKISNLWEFS